MIPIPPRIRTVIPLAQHTSFGIGGPAEYFLEAASEEDFCEAVAWAKAVGVPTTLLGGGSNVLIDDSGVRGLVVKMGIKGINYREQDGGIEVTAAAGETFDDFVSALVKRNIGGLENLSGIPGTVGATPVQNVGAYGVEVKDWIVAVRVFDIDAGIVRTMSRSECSFGYRSSVFKTDEGKRYAILAVTFYFPHGTKPKLDYKDIVKYFGEQKEPTLSEIRNAILSIRGEKFPDMSVVGTAGSFFKNPSISMSDYDALKARYPELPGYSEPHGRVKIPLGYVLDRVLGLKGYRVGDVGLHEHQALVLVRYGKHVYGTSTVTAHDIKEFAHDIASRVFDATGIEVEWEVCELS